MTTFSTTKTEILSLSHLEAPPDSTRTGPGTDTGTGDNHRLAGTGLGTHSWTEICRVVPDRNFVLLDLLHDPGLEDCRRRPLPVSGRRVVHTDLRLSHGLFLLFLLLITFTAHSWRGERESRFFFLLQVL